MNAKAFFSPPPAPHSDLSQIHRGSEESDEIWRKARANGTDFATARAEQTVEDAKAGKGTITDRLKRAIGLESAAEKQLREAQQLTREAVALQARWDAMISDLDALRARSEQGQGQVADLRAGVENCRAHLAGAIGTNPFANGPIDLAIEIAKGLAALPILEQAAEVLAESYRAKIIEVRAFGEANGIPKKLLAQLPA